MYQNYCKIIRLSFHSLLHCFKIHNCLFILPLLRKPVPKMLLSLPLYLFYHSYFLQTEYILSRNIEVIILITFLCHFTTTIQLAFIIRLTKNKIFVTDVRFLASPQPPPWMTWISLFVWVITFDLSGMGVPTSSYTNASLTLQII